MSKKESVPALLLIIAVFISFGGWIFGYNSWRVWLAIKSAQWPTTTGKIISSQICEHHYKGISYYPCIKYSYLVAGRLFESDTITIAHRDPGRYEIALEIAQKYPVGRQVPVYYDPAVPLTACLEPKVIPWENYIPIILGPFLVLVGILILLIKLPEIRSWRRRDY